MIQIWFKLFYRNSKKNWLNVLINIVGLTLGFAGLLFVLLYLNDENSYNATNPYKNEVYRVLHKMSDGDIWSVSTSVEGSEYEEKIPEINAYYFSYNWYEDVVLKVDRQEVYTRNILEGEPNFFDFFPFQIIEGSSTTFKEARNNIAISEKTAKSLFGNQSAIGKTIEFFNRSFIVTTVYKIIGKHYYMPEGVIQFKKQPKGDWNNFSFSLFIKTNKNVNLKEVSKKANDVWHDSYVMPLSKEKGISPEDFFKRYGITAIFESLKDIRLKTKAEEAGPEGKGNYQLILIMLSLSILLIIISCVNVINLSTASATQRAKEVGVKKTLGLSKFTLIRQFALEIMFQGLLAFVLSLIVVESILPYFNDFMDKEISILQGNTILKVGALAILISFLVGNIPAVYLSNFKSVEVLKGNISRSKRGIFARNIMLGLQFLISGFFLVGSVIIYQQVNYIMDKDLGFKGDQIVLIPMNEYKNRYKKYQLAKKELIKHPNIEAITSNSFIIGGGSANSANVDFKDISVQTNANAMDFNYLDVMDIEIIKGRNLDERRASDTIKNILINETLAKALNIYDNPIGKKIDARFGGGDNDGKGLNIIGMVKDYHINGLDSKIPPMILMHWNSFDWMKNNFWMMQFKINPNNVKETLNQIEKYWKENVEQGYPFNPTFLNKRFAKTYKKYQKQQTLFSILTSVVILVSLLGLFALSTLTIQQRLKEVAIRKTLGASVKEIMYQLISSFLKITLISSFILIPIAYYFMQNWLENFVYRTEMPLFPFILTPVLLIVLVFVVVGIKAFKATKIDLIKYLKFE